MASLQRSIQKNKAHMKSAYAYAELSHARRLKVGAVIVKEDRIVSIGYNGVPSGRDNIAEVEEWKETKYTDFKVSNAGRLKYKDIILNTYLSKKGYPRPHLPRRGMIESIIGIHRIVAETFIENPNPELYSQVNHIDKDKTNNSVLNLEWCTPRYNSTHRSEQREFPTGIYYDNLRDKFVAYYYDGNSTNVIKRFSNAQDAIDWRESIENPEEYITYKFKGETKSKDEVCHAEMNAILFAARNGVSTDRCSIYVTHAPCYDCAKYMVQAGIKEVYFDEEYRDMRSVEFLKLCGVNVYKINDEEMSSIN